MVVARLLLLLGWCLYQSAAMGTADLPSAPGHVCTPQAQIEEWAVGSWKVDMWKVSDLPR